MSTVLPLSDASRKPRHVPFVTILIIVANIFVFLQELLQGDAFVAKWVVVPAHIVTGQDWITLLTAMFMHASWSHIIGNMMFLWAFGPAIEDAMNPLRYAVFYLSSGLVGMLAQIAANPQSTIPCLGASAAIAGVMGAFLVTYPRDKIRSIFIFLIFVRITFIPAALLIGIWFVTQLINVGAVANLQTGGIAYLAHVGGFLVGCISARFFEQSQPD